MTKLYTDPFGPPWRLQWLRLLFNWGGSIFQFFWIEWLVATTLCFAYILIWYSMWDGKTFEEISDSTQAFLSAVNYITSRFQAALSLMLGFYTSTHYGRWWKVRDIEGVVIGRINDLAVQIAGFIRDNPPSNNAPPLEGQAKNASIKEDLEEDQVDVDDAVENFITDDANNEQTSKSTTTIVDANDVRLTLVRWLNLAHALTVGELYEKKPNEFTSLKHIRDFGLLTDLEYDYMDRFPRSRYAAPFVWFLDLLHDLKDKGQCGVSFDTIIVFSSNITKIRGSLADLSMYRNVPVPLSYRQLVNFTVRAYLLIVAVAGGLSAFEHDRASETFEISSSMCWVVLPFFFEYFIFVGWLTVSDALGNPFRNWADEFEWENYVRSVALSSNLFVTETRNNSMKLEKLKASTASVQQKKEEIFDEWETNPVIDYNMEAGYKEFRDGSTASKRGRGIVKMRKAVTGY
uniref:Bestrophin homolog n=1 Tax=Helicotheca tamesis TaxID=374047 RepID=A0A7S2I0S7_9STRA|mmetsp:Transcript_4546/g.6221  ORF Transcript_4546/g.6221 Transcript_4546/m.6221 type:complete len:460 (+) Transcript_4546:69-1448(+)